MTDHFTIATVQHACAPERERNLAAAEAGVREAASCGAQIICLQELFASPYFCSVEEHAFFDLAEPSDGPTVTRLAQLAGSLKVALVIPFFERRAAGIYHNSAAVADADGKVLGIYRKMHIPDDPLYYEKFYFVPGDAVPEGDGFKVFATRYGKVGVLICWDQWYPEGARITALKGAEVIFYPTAIGWHPKEKAEFGEKQHQAWQTIQRSHAIANGVYVAAPNRIGFEPTPGTDGIQFFGRSFISDPFGEIVTQAGSEEPQVLVHRCSRTALEDTRRHWPFLRDRRIDAYGNITRRFIGE